MDWTDKKGEVVHFQHLPSSDTVQVYLEYRNSAFNIDRKFNFSRKLTEPIDIFLGRVRGNIEKELNKKTKKKKSNEPIPGTILPQIPSSINLLENSEPLKDICVQDVLAKIAENPSGHRYYLDIFGEPHQIKLNLPWVTNIQMPSSILAGYFVYPNKLETLFCSKKDLQYVWYRGRDGNWTKVGEGLSYMVNNDDINYQLKLKCISQSLDSSLEFERTANCVVQAGPGECPFEERHLYTPDYLRSNEFRVMTYNILADLYSDSDYSRDVLFGYCQKYALNIDYRKQLFIKEILGYHSDIICLQEVDTKLFDLDLVSIFEEKDYSLIFAEKRDVGEGVAILFRNKRFIMLDSYKFDVGENIQKHDVFKEIDEKLKRNEQLYTRVVERPNTLLVLVIRSVDNPRQVLIVANTHLYFHPDADHIRLLQAGMCIMYIENVIVNEVKRKHIQPEDKISIIFAGDFNSDPLSGIFQLMTTGSIKADHKDWGSSKGCDIIFNHLYLMKIGFADQEEWIKGIELAHPFKMANATGTSLTNYTEGFKECLDYIYYQTDHLKVEKTVPFPSEEQLSAHIAIPSIVFPSDHVALVADFSFREEQL